MTNEKHKTVFTSMVNSVNGCVLSAVVVRPQQSQAVLACTDGSLCVECSSSTSSAVTGRAGLY